MEFEEIYVNVPWGRLCVVCSGPKDGPPILFLHGNQDSASTFFPLIKYFPKHFRLHMLELPGCGKSTHLPGIHHIYLYDFIYSVQKTVEHFELNNFTFIAHSMGNQIGLYFNAIYPGFINKFVSLDHVSYEPITSELFPLWFKMTYENYFEPSVHKKMISGYQNNPKYTYDKALALVMKNRGLTKEAGETVLIRTLIPTDDGLYRFCWDQRMKMISTPPHGVQSQIDLYGNLKFPHLTIVSTNSVDSRLRNTSTKLLEANILNNPNYRILLVEGNHDVHLNKPAEIASHIVPFLLDQDVAKEESLKLIEKFKENLKLDLKKRIKSKL